jgi:hypothetical protein
MLFSFPTADLTAKERNIYLHWKWKDVVCLKTTNV